MKLHYKSRSTQKADCKAGNTRVLKQVVEQTEEFYHERLLKEKEDIRLYQGYLQALKAIREAISP